MEKIVVGISMLEEEESRELLSWAINVAARPGDTVLALHVLVLKDDKKLDSTQNKIDRANAFTINLLGVFTDLCQAKQVKVEAKVLVHSSVEKGLVDEADALKASFLILGASTDQTKRPTLGVTKYCLQHAPARCSVITVKSRRIPNQTENFPRIYDNLDILDEGIHKLNLKWPHMDLSKTLVSLQKRLLSKIASGNTEVTFAHKRSNNFLQSKEKISPKQASEQEHEVSSHSISKTSIFHQASDCDEEFVSGLNQQNCLNILRNVNLTFPPLFPSSFGRHSVKDNEKYSSETYHPHGKMGRSATPSIPKPSWRCFTYEEIALATNNFNPGTPDV